MQRYDIDANVVDETKTREKILNMKQHYSSDIFGI
jgi:hypothetical protein